MKIIHIIPNLTNGGAENVLAHLALEIKKKNFKQSIFTLDNSINDFNYQKLKDFVEVNHLENDPRKLVKTLKKNKKAIVICWLYKAFFVYELLSIKFNLKNKYYWNVRHSDFGPFQIKQKIFLCFMGLYSNLSKCNIIYCSQKSKITHEKYFFKKRNNCVIQNRLAKPPPVSFRIPEKGKYILFIGRMHAQKSPPFLKKIFNFIQTQNQGVKLIIIGKGWTKDFFKTNSNSLVIFEQKENIYDYLKYASCLLFTSKFGEGYPNVIAEAMSVGTPIVGFDSGDYIKMTKDYLLASVAKSESDFFNGVNKFLKNEKKLSDKEKTIVLRKLDFNQTVKQYLELL